MGSHAVSPALEHPASEAVFAPVHPQQEGKLEGV